MIITAVLACLLHHVFRTFRWYGASRSWAGGIYHRLTAMTGLVQYDIYGGEKQFFKNGAKEIEMNLRWHTGSIKRLFTPLYFRLQNLSLILAFVFVLLSGVSPLLLFLPGLCWLLSFGYFHFFGWKWLRHACLGEK